MAKRSATAVWHGNLFTGGGTVSSASGSFSDQKVDWKLRTEAAGGGTSPEELIAAAHATCYAMAFSNALDQAGHPPQELDVTADVEFQVTDAGPKITSSHLTVKGKVPGVNDEQFKKLAQDGEKGCPVSNALRGNVDITVDASLA